MDLFTIGYQGLDQGQFLKYLHRFEISVVADVRRLPLSRKKGFSKTPLMKALSERDIEYINFRELGTTKDMRAEIKETGEHRDVFERFRNALTGEMNQIDKILSMVNDGKRVALLCFEKDPGQCHRKIVAQEIKKRAANGLRIRHIEPA